MTQGPLQPERSVVAYLKDRDKACPSCGYNVRGIREPACPECGWKLEFTTLSPAAYARRRWFWLVGMAGGLCSMIPLSLAAGSAFVATVERSDWTGFLIAVLLVSCQFGALLAWWFGAAWLRRRQGWIRWSFAALVSWGIVLPALFALGVAVAMF